MAIDKIWRIKKPDKEIIKEIVNRHNVSEVLATILVNRGIVEEEAINRFVSPSVDSFYDPFLLEGMQVAVGRVLKAIDNQEKVCIYGDYDVDGVTSTSIMYLFLKDIGCDISYYIPDRHEEGYGVNKEALKYIKEQGNNLVITVDTGITANEQADYAKEIGLDLIITDHHECPEVLPQAVAVINPKKDSCNYPFKSLAGCGVAFKLIHGIAKSLNVEGKIYPLLEIVAVGTVADIVPLVDENRIIVKTAFKTMFNTNNVGLKALLDVSEVKDNKITAGIIGFRVGPRLNAAGRLGDAKRCVRLFTTDDKEEAKRIALELDEENKLRQSIEAEIFEEADLIIEQSINVNKSKVLVVAGNEWNHGVIGIVASRITEKYYRPTILLTVKDGIASGSARSVEGFSIFAALSNCKELFDKFGGHEMAAGMSLKAENVDALRQRLNEYAKETMLEDTLIPKVSSDMVLDIQAINIELINNIATLEPYGMGNEEPKFNINGKLLSAFKMGKEKNHLKLKLHDRDKEIEAIGFRIGDYYHYVKKEDSIQMIATLSINEWRNQKNPQLMLKDLKVGNDFYDTIGESLKVINNIDEIDIEDIKKQGHLPSRKDFEILYRVLITYNKKKQSRIYMQELVKDLEINETNSILRYLLCLCVFEELELVNTRLNKYYCDFKLIKGKKVELTDSTLYNDMSYSL